MPELPEIETIKSVIEPQIKGLTIEKNHCQSPGGYRTAGRRQILQKPLRDKIYPLCHAEESF